MSKFICNNAILIINSNDSWVANTYSNSYAQVGVVCKVNEELEGIIKLQLQPVTIIGQYANLSALKVHNIPIKLE